MAPEELSHHKLIKESHIKATLKADKGDKAQLSDWSVVDFTEKGDNYATVVTSVSVSYILEGKSQSTSYIVKVNPDRGYPGVKMFITTLFEKEAMFYETVAPALNMELAAVGLEPLRIARWFYSSLEKGQEVIFLEDLRPRGFKMFDRLKGLDIPHTLLVLKEVARLHAASVLLQAKFPDEDLAERHSFLKLGWLNNSRATEEILSMAFVSSMESAAEMLRNVGGYEKAEKWLHENKNAFIDLLKSHLTKEDPFYVVCHGDCWNNNMLFRYNDEGLPVEVMMVDLQFSQMTSPATDLNYLLFTSLTGDVRRSNVTDFLMSYYSSFNSVMETARRPMPFSTEQLLQEYRNRNEYGLVFVVYLITVIIRKPDEASALDRNVEVKDVSKLTAKNKQYALNVMETNPLLKPRFLAVFDELTDIGFFD